MGKRPSAEDAFTELIVRGSRDLSGAGGGGSGSCDDGFPSILKPLVFGVLWTMLAALLSGLAVVWLRYLAGAG